MEETAEERQAPLTPEINQFLGRITELLNLVLEQQIGTLVLMISCDVPHNGNLHKLTVEWTLPPLPPNPPH